MARQLEMKCVNRTHKKKQISKEKNRKTNRHTENKQIVTRREVSGEWLREVNGIKSTLILISME